MTSLLPSLLKRSTITDHDEALKASDVALKSSSNDTQAQQTKAIALLKLERYADALKHFEDSSSLQQAIPEAYAYCLYRSGKFEEAVKVVSAVQDSRGAQHITLQAGYRAEDWDAASEAHTQLSKTHVAKEDSDLRVNTQALNAEGLWLEKLSPASVQRATTDDLSAFETAYNAACISVSKGQLQEADILLKRAISLCEHHDSLTEEEKVGELIPLKAQRVFVLQRLQKQDEAKALAKEIEEGLDSPAVDAATRKLAENNVLTASSMSNPFLAHKTFNQSSIPVNERLFANQTTALISNAKTIQLQSFKYDGLINACRKRSEGDEASFTANDLLVSMFSAAALARGEISKAAINKVLPELEKRPNDVGLAVTIVQLYVLTGNTTAAVDMLHQFFERLEKSTTTKDQDIRFSPGLVGLLVSLYKSQGRRSQLKQELAKSASYWRTKSKAPSSLLRAAGVALLDSTTPEDAQEAKDIFEKLYSQESEDHSTIAGYVASHATAPSAEVKSLSEKLSSVADLTSSINVDALEIAGIPQSANALAIAQAGQSRKRAAADGLSSKKKKRVRKGRMPKDFDPNKKPDPERWLPLRDRSTYRPKKKKGKRDDRTQGGGNVNESLDISNRPAASASEVVTGNANKKKKGKGKK